jgi:chemotaxis protein histidine kinase CheA
MSGGMVTEDAAAKIAARLRELWRTSKPTVLERMTALHTACSSLVQNPGDAEARLAGLEAAHKLAGVLGIFGMPQGSEIASAIEALLKAGETLSPGDLAILRGQIADLDAVIAAKADQ